MYEREREKEKERDTGSTYHFSNLLWCKNDVHSPETISHFKYGSFPSLAI
jgi:hypothetical protein